MKHMGGSSGGQGGSCPPCPSPAPQLPLSLYLNDIDVPYRAYMLASPCPRPCPALPPLKEISRAAHDET